MASNEVNVTIEYQGTEQTFSLRRGLGLQALNVRNQTSLEFDCRKADCGICICHVVEGAENLSPPTFQEKDFLKAMRAAPDERLACQTRVFGDCKIVLDDYS